MNIDPSHPRAESLRIREQLVWGVKHGLTSTAGLLAHGRGEAFDYLIGEITHDFAKRAIEAGAATLLLSKHPMLSINGNTAALCAKEYIQLAKLLDCKIEVNLFHYTKTRVQRIERYLRPLGGNKHLLSTSKEATITLPGIASARKVVLREGIAKADTVFVPLEDGDRCEALVKLGKKVITIDLNPLSRTARNATITIVDNITRALPLLIKDVKYLKKTQPAKLETMVNSYTNDPVILDALSFIT